MDYTSVSQANIEQVESLLELLSNVYDYTIKRYQDLNSEPRYSYDEEKRKSKRQELDKLERIEAHCLAQREHWEYELEWMKCLEQSERNPR